MTDTTKPNADSLTPSEILARLDDYVVGQDKAKRAVAVALRNRWRRRQLPPELALDVHPKNILLIGPTGVGKTEIARRLASLARAPFVKVEATKYSEVGYHGRDVESMVRDLVESGVAIVRREHAETVKAKAHEAADNRLFEALCEADDIELDYVDYELTPEVGGDEIWRPIPVAEYLQDETDASPDGTSPDGSSTDADDQDDQDPEEKLAEAQRQALRLQLQKGEIENREIEIEVQDSRVPTLNITGPQGNDAMGIDTAALQEMWGRSSGPKTKLRKLTVAEARKLIEAEEAEKLMDEDAVFGEALERTENDGIVFIDEVDKVIGAGKSDGPDVSREGVQRDLLSVVEGCEVYTKYGHVRTDHILFIAAGAFHFHKPSELIPELQGRFPVRVALQSLTEEDFVHILKDPKNSLTRQYHALFSTEGVELEFTPDGIARIAALSFRANQTTQDIGARRLLTIMEKCVEDLSFRASEMGGQKVMIDRALVDDVLGETADDEDLIKYEL